MEILFLNYLFLLNQTPKEKFAIEVRSLLFIDPSEGALVQRLVKPDLTNV